MARQCRQYGLGDGLCDYWNQDDPDDNFNLPSGCDPETGECNPTNDWTEDCDNFFSTEEEECEDCGRYESECVCGDEDVCDYCGEPLGFCAIDCETKMEDFDE